jgi:DNA-binding beta-propeller fold protein YncE
MLGSLAACGSDNPTSPTPPTGSIEVTPGRLVLGVGMSRQLSVTVADASGAPISSATVNFESSDPTRAAVTEDGVVSFVGAGGAEIRISSDDLQVVIPYDGIQAGHPQGTITSSIRLPGDTEGDAPFGAAIDADGRIFISQADSGQVASFLFPATGFTTGDLGGRPTSIVLLSGGTALVTPTGAEGTSASVIDLATDSVLAEIPLGVEAFSAVATADSGTVYLGTNDGRVLRFDVASSSITGSIDLAVEKSRVNHLALNPSGRLLYASSFTTGTISEIDITSQSVARLLFVGGEPQGIAVSSDGTELFVANETGKGRIDVYDLVANVHQTSLPSGATTSLGGPFGLAISPDGAQVYVGVITTEGPGLIHVIDVASRTIERTFNSCGMAPRRIAFGFSGGLAVIADESGCVNVVE